MKFSFAIVLAAAVLLMIAASVVEAKKRESVDSLRIGVKHRPEECTRKTKSGDKLKMHYRGTLLKDGKQFDASYDRGDPFTFTLGAGQVIKGWDQGLNGMCIGEKRKLVIPSHLAYGERGSPPTIPGGASLVFEVELMDIVT